MKKITPWATSNNYQLSANATVDVEGFAMEKYECPCGYIYDPAEGDYEHGIEVGTAFKDLPDDWVCPKCGAEKQFFYEI